jgi:CDP-diacylglycerol--serine O-phosphatidyltransferase
MHGLRDLILPGSATISEFLSKWLIPIGKISLPIVTLAVACLMVSRFRYAHVFNQLFRGRANRQHLIQLVFTLAVIFVVKELALPLIFCYFAFSAPARWLWNDVFVRRLHKSSMVEPERESPAARR